MSRVTRRGLLAAGALGLTAPLGLPAARAQSTPDRSADPIPPTGRDGLTALEREDPEHLLALVTKKRALEPEDYAPTDLVPWRDPHYQLRAEVADQLGRLVDEAAAQDVGLRVVSGYRSYATQAEVFDYWVRTAGRDAAEATSARPGHSEHQTGLAVDLDGTSGGCYLRACFADTPAGRWVAAHGYRHGFVLSYPQGRQERTGYAFEPWHLRYVGPRAAGEMHSLGDALLQDYLATRLVVREVASALSRV